MHVDLARQPPRHAAHRAGAQRAAPLRHFEAQRRRVDARFDPRQALAATVRYLTIARKTFGRDDLAVTSYHMGIGNLESVLRDYTGSGSGTPIAELVKNDHLSYAQVYFDSSPLRHPQAWSLLARLGDDSSNYYWKLLAAQQIMQLYRSDPGRADPPLGAPERPRLGGGGAAPAGLDAGLRHARGRGRGGVRAPAGEAAGRSEAARLPDRPAARPVRRPTRPEAGALPRAAARGARRCSCTCRPA